MSRACDQDFLQRIALSNSMARGKTMAKLLFQSMDVSVSDLGVAKMDLATRNRVRAGTVDAGGQHPLPPIGRRGHRRARIVQRRKGLALPSRKR